MDGYLRIKTKLDNKGIDKDISELEDKIKKLQTDNANSSTEERAIQQEINNYEKLIEEADKYKQKLKSIEEDKKLYSNLLTGKNKIVTDKSGTNWVVDANTNANVQKTQDKLKALKLEEDSIKNKIKEITLEFGNSSGKIDKLYSKLGKVKAKQTENNTKISEYKQKIEQINLKKVENSIDSVGRNIQNSIGKIGKMAMAVMGLRTAWGAVRSAVGMVSQYNSQVSTDFEYIRYCIANAIAPAVQYLIQLLYTVLSYVNAIASAWFGINLFSNSSAKNFKKMQNSAGGTAKSAKEIQKSLQGFDEMNILQGDGSTSGNTGVGIPTPSMDLSEIENVNLDGIYKITDKIKEIFNIGFNNIKENVKKVAQDLGFSEDFINAWEDAIDGVKIIIDGFLDVVGGIIETIGGLLSGDAEKVKEGLKKIIIGIGEMIGGLVQSIINIFKMAIIFIYDTILKPIADWIYENVIKPIIEFFMNLWNEICNIFSNIGKWFSDTFNSAKDGIMNAFSSIGKFFSDIWNSICNIFSNVGIWFSNKFTEAITGIKSAFGTIGNFFKDVWQNICNIFGNVAGWFREKFTGAWEAVKNVFSTGGKIFDGIKEGILNGLKTIVNAIISGINKVIATPFNGLNSALRKIKSVDILGVRPFNFINTIGVPQIPRLAKGAVLTRPTPVIAGEAGAEAFIPLENNTEGLELIAEKIASKIGLSGGSFIINMDGRTIQRGIARRQNELAFARNGR